MLYYAHENGRSLHVLRCPARGTGGKVHGIGLNFNPNEKARGIDDPVVQEIQ